MLSLVQIEQDLTSAMKSRDQITVGTLRGLKTRIQNEKVSKMRDLEAEEVVALIRSEVKRRKEAAGAFEAAGRTELAEKELEESKVLEKYLPAQLSEEEILSLVEQVVAENAFTAQDFGKAMGVLKSKVGQTADGTLLAKVLKEKLK